MEWESENTEIDHIVTLTVWHIYYIVSVSLSHNDSHNESHVIKWLLLVIFFRQSVLCVTKTVYDPDSWDSFSSCQRDDCVSRANGRASLTSSLSESVSDCQTQTAFFCFLKNFLSFSLSVLTMWQFLARFDARIDSEQTRNLSPESLPALLALLRSVWLGCNRLSSDCRDSWH